MNKLRLSLVSLGIMLCGMNANAQAFQKDNSFISVGYDIGGSFRVAADITYQMQFDQMVNQKNRFDNKKLALKYYDAYDDSKLGNWNFSIHFLFPLKFVYSGSFKSI